MLECRVRLLDSIGAAVCEGSQRGAVGRTSRHHRLQALGDCHDGGALSHAAGGAVRGSEGVSGRVPKAVPKIRLERANSAVKLTQVQRADLAGYS